MFDIIYLFAVYLKQNASDSIYIHMFSAMFRLQIKHYIHVLVHFRYLEYTAYFINMRVQFVRVQDLTHLCSTMRTRLVCAFVVVGACWFCQIH